MTKKLTHPLEDVFGMEEGSTPLGYEQNYDRVDPMELAQAQQAAMMSETEAAIPPDIKDEDDVETDKKIDAVYDAAMQTFQQQTAYTEIIEPRYAARNAEVAAQFLGIALNAAGMKAKVKSDRKRTNAAFIPYANNKNSQNIVADRNDILSMITVDTETKEIK